MKKRQNKNQVGKKVGATRRKKKMPLKTLANETGFTVDFLKDIESGSVLPTVGALIQISRTLHVKADYLTDPEGGTNARCDIYEKRVKNRAYSALTSKTAQRRLNAFHVTIDPLQHHQGLDHPHEGKEFIYVLPGEIELTVGNKVNELTTTDYLHFNSGVSHQIKNIGTETATLLAVV